MRLFLASELPGAVLAVVVPATRILEDLGLSEVAEFFALETEGQLKPWSAEHMRADVPVRVDRIVNIFILLMVRQLLLV